MLLWLLMCLIPLLVVPPADSECGRTADIAFLIDSSSSISSQSLGILRTFFSDIVNAFDVSPDKTQFAAVSFSNVTKNEFNFTTYNNKNDVLNAVNNMKFIQGNAARTYAGLEEITDVVFDPKNGARDNIVKIIVVLTDSNTDPGGYDTYTNKDAKAETQRQAQRARDKGIYIFVIGIGPNIDEEELQGIASDPDSTFLLLVDLFRKLNAASVKQLVLGRMCEVPARAKRRTGHL